MRTEFNEKVAQAFADLGAQVSDDGVIHVGTSFPEDAKKAQLGTGASHTGLLNIKLIREALEELEVACQRTIDISNAFADTVKTVARKACVEPAVLAAFVNARVKDTLDDQQKKAEQLSLLFDEIR